MRVKIFVMAMFFMGASVLAQQKTITGTVTASEDGESLVGVSVSVKGTEKGTETDFDGKYSIKVSEGETLVFSYLGYKTVESLVKKSSIIDIVLISDNTLDEVVVVAYGSRSKGKIIQTVAVVDEKALKNLVVTSPDQLLQGQSSGVQVVSTSGLLGSNVNVRVRGISTLNGSSAPLFVVDGVVITDNNNTFNRGGATGQNPLSFINPSDIESLTVLKDAGATAPYGTRGSNGVILITTKKGRRNTNATVTFNSFLQNTEVNDIFDILSPDQYRGFRTDIRNIQQGTNLNPEDIGLGAFGSGGGDYVDAVSRTGFTHHTDISVRGGSEKTSYYISATYEEAESFALGNDQTRFAFRANLENQTNDWLTIGTNLSLTSTDLNSIGRQNNTFATFTSAFLQNPTFKIKDDNGAFLPSPTFIPNIAAIAALDKDKIEGFRIIANAYAKIDFQQLPGLSFKTEFGVDRLRTEELIRSFEVNTPGGNANFLGISDNLYRVTNSLSYITKINENHNLSFLVLQEFEERRRRIIQLTGTGFITDDITNVGGATTQVVNLATRSGSIITGYLGSMAYDYKGKYLFEATGRIDGSSRFGSNKRYGKFWSVAGGWTISKEDFFEDVNFVDFLSFRASIGTSGNDRLGNFPSLGLFAPGQFGGVTNVVIAQPSNNNLGFEKTQTIDFGLKTAILDNKVNIAVSYFERETTDLLLALRTPPQTGAGTLNQNVGAIKNVGWEFDISSVNIRTKDFEWNTSFNFTTIKNEVLKLNADASVDAEGRRFIETGSQRAIEGLSLSNFFLVRYVGVNSQTGDAEWLDASGNVTTSPNFNTDRVLSDKSALPDFSGGITNTFRYKNFDLSTVFNFSVGNSILVDGLRFIDGADAIGGIGNVRTQNLNFWRNPGDNAFLPSPLSSTFNNYNQRSTAQLFDASYLRLKNVTLGYVIPEGAFKNTGINSVRLYLTSTNLFTVKGKDLKGIDPEQNASNNPLAQGVTFFTAPQAKTYLLGVTVQF
jgi:TonB-linked SusC/RagA family outer membrane protein